MDARMCVRPSVRPSVCPSVRPSVRLSVRPSVRPSVRLSVCPSVRLSVCPSVRPSVNHIWHYNFWTSERILTIFWISAIKKNRISKLQKLGSYGCRYGLGSASPKFRFPLSPLKISMPHQSFWYPWKALELLSVIGYINLNFSQRPLPQAAL